jgi:hypothetical protein
VGVSIDTRCLADHERDVSLQPTGNGSSANNRWFARYEQPVTSIEITNIEFSFALAAIATVLAEMPWPVGSVCEKRQLLRAIPTAVAPAIRVACCKSCQYSELNQHRYIPFSKV